MRWPTCKVMCPTDGWHFERIVNVPKRGLGDGTVRKMQRRSPAPAGMSLARRRPGLLVETEDLPAKARKSLRNLLEISTAGAANLDTLPHTELPRSCWTSPATPRCGSTTRTRKRRPGWTTSKNLSAPWKSSRTMPGFLEHISLVMDVEQREYEPKASLMTLHAAKGLEFDTVFLPGWEEGLFPSQRSLDESGKAGLEEERRLAYVGITRARKHCTISFAQNRRVHAMWQTALPSRFIDELPAEHVEVDTMSSSYGGYGVGGADSFGGSRFDEVKPFNSGYDTPGWKRAQARHAEGSAYRSTPHIIEGTLTASDAGAASFARGDRVHHQKFGPGTVTHVDGNKLSISFDQAGDKRVLDSFVSRA
jgi:DNA helicase-2/ATP-dependent DNA helicase PcrA